MHGDSIAGGVLLVARYIETPPRPPALQPYADTLVQPWPRQRAPVSALCVLALTRRRFLTIPHNPGGFAPSGRTALRVVAGSLTGQDGETWAQSTHAL